MAQIPTEQEIRTAYESAQKNIKDYVVSEDLQKKFHDIRTNHNLHLDEAGKLTDALVATFLELSPMSEFPNLLREVLEQNSDQHESVLKEVNDKIFTSFRNKLEGKPDEIEELAPQKEPETANQGSNVPILEKKINEGVKKISVGTLDSSPKTQTQKEKEETSYRGVDPYRESI